MHARCRRLPGLLCQAVLHGRQAAGGADAAQAQRPREDAEGAAAAENPYAQGGAILRGHSRPVYGLDFSLDERLLLSASGDGTVRLWSTEIGANLVAYR